MTPGEVVDQLYRRYHEADETPADIVSSHWRAEHAKTTVRRGEGSTFVAEGSGFGDVCGLSALGRLTNALTIRSYMAWLPQRREIGGLLPEARGLARDLGLDFSYDAFRQACAAQLLLSRTSLPDEGDSGSGPGTGPRPVLLEIGGGYGVFSGLVRRLRPGVRAVLVDLGKTLFFQALHLTRAFPDATHALIGREATPGTTMDQADFVYCPAESLSMLGDTRFDLVVNIASMQEMKPEVVDAYFAFIRRHVRTSNLFYCCNRERKEMPGGEVSEFLRYPWRSGDEHLVDGPCPWYRYFLSGHTAARGPSVLGVRVPFVNHFDGDIVHRLTVLEPDGDQAP